MKITCRKCNFQKEVNMKLEEESFDSFNPTTQMGLCLICANHQMTEARFPFSKKRKPKVFKSQQSFLKHLGAI